jgi:Mrp family chromosome partitioning ATPase
VSGTIRSDILALLLVIGLAVAAGAAMVAVAQATAPAFAASVVWSAPGAAGALDDLRSVPDVEALRAWSIAPEGLQRAIGGGRSPVRVHVTGDRGGVEVRLEAIDWTPWAAAARAAEAAAAVEAWDVAAARAGRQQEIAELDDRADALAASIRMLQVGDAAAAAATLAAQADERDAVLRRRDALAAIEASASPPGALVRTGGTSWALSPPVARSAAMAASLGAAVGGSIVLILSFWTRRSPRARHGQASDAPHVLTTFPAGSHPTSSSSRDAVDHLRARLIAMTPGVDTRVFVITANPGVDGKSTVACRLAESLASHGTRTLLVDAVLSAPELAERYLGSANQNHPGAGLGVASTLTWLEDPEGDHRVATVAIGGNVMLDLVPQERPIWLAPGTAETFYRGLEQALVRWDGYDAIVIDAPALTPAGDVRWIAPYATGVVLVVGSGRGEERALQEARRLIRGAQTPLLGLVVSVPPRSPIEAASPLP